MAEGETNSYPFGQDMLEQQAEKAEQHYRQQAYQDLAKRLKPRPPVARDALGAFVVGGLICVVAQAILNAFTAYGWSVIDGGTATVIIMVFLGALLTGLGVYDNIAKVAGAGSILPITGFANSIVAPAMEFKREGYVYGIGARMFTVAGPVLTYGFVISILIGLIAILTR